MFQNATSLNHLVDSIKYIQPKFQVVLIPILPSKKKNLLVQNKLEARLTEVFIMFQIATSLNHLVDSVKFLGSNRYKSPLVSLNVGQLPISYCRSFSSTLSSSIFFYQYHGI
jgi:hypothetical protein